MRAGPCGADVRGSCSAAYCSYRARCSGDAESVGTTTSTWETQAPPIRVSRAEGADVRELDRGKVGGLRPRALGFDDAAGQQVHPVLARPPGRPQAAAAVPHPPGQGR